MFEWIQQLISALWPKHLWWIWTFWWCWCAPLVTSGLDRSETRTHARRCQRHRGWRVFPLRSDLCPHLSEAARQPWLTGCKTRHACLTPVSAYRDCQQPLTSSLSTQTRPLRTRSGEGELSLRCPLAANTPRFMLITRFSQMFASAAGSRWHTIKFLAQAAAAEKGKTTRKSSDLASLTWFVVFYSGVCVCAHTHVPVGGCVSRRSSSLFAPISHSDFWFWCSKECCCPHKRENQCVCVCLCVFLPDAFL